MGESSLGLTEAISIALGGMIGGGIYAVLGVVTGIVGPATWAAFILAGVVAICAGYSYVTLNAIDEEHSGGAVTFVERFVGNSTLAGMTGWTLLVGYVGSMAMYAYAFGEFAVGMSAVPDGLAGVPLRPLVSVFAVALFVGLNLLGAHASGVTEDVLVAAKVLVLVVFGAGGILVLLLGWRPEPIRLGVDRLVGFSPIMAGAVSFVAFQGWQLLFYDQDRIEDPVSTITRAVYLAIPVAVFIYVIVAIATVSVAPEALESNPHTALTQAASTLASPLGLGGLAALAITLSALVSTGSAINATLFSSGYFAKKLLAEDLLPDQLGDAEAGGVPTVSLLVLGGITAALAALGSLAAITSFASLTFILIFGGVSLLAVFQRDRDEVAVVPPVVGTVGSFLFAALLGYHLFRAERGTFVAVLVLATAVLAVEVLYFERDLIASEARSIEQAIESRSDD